jgi:SAM-dependent methyltransferase
MKPANDPTINYKALVQQAYDLCADDYDKSRPRVAPPELNLLTSRLNKGAAVLDIGCGAGVPIAQTLSRRFKVTGVDISGEMLKRARVNVPEANLIEGDIMSIDFPPDSFNAGIAFYSIFHLPRSEHAELLRRIYQWLKPSGYLLATLSYNNEPAYTDEYLGTTMYWSNFGLEEYRRLLAEAGFTITVATSIGGGYKDPNEAPDERHPLVLAQKE